MTYGKTLYNVSGDINLHEDWPKGAKILLKPEADLDEINFEYNVQNNENKYNILGSYELGDRASKFEGNVEFNHKYDWEIRTKLNTPLEEYKTFSVDAKMLTPNMNNMTFYFESNSPFKGLETTKFGYTFIKKDTLGLFGIYHSFANTLGQIKINWKMQLFENIVVKLIANQRFEDKINKDIVADLFYLNKNESFDIIKFASNFNVDKDLYIFGSNFSISLVQNDYGIGADLRLPVQADKVHSIRGRYGLKDSKSEEKKFEYLAKYFMKNTDILYGVSGEVRNVFVQNLVGV